jgi:hypothetical protein
MALSEGRGYGEAGGEGLFASCQISESLTHRFAVPPLPQAGEGCCQLIFRHHHNVQTQRHRLSAAPSSWAVDCRVFEPCPGTRAQI